MPELLRTAQADADLLDIWLFIAQDNPEAADRVMDAMEARWQRLLVHPWSGVAREDIGPGIRCLVSGQYLTLYRVETDSVRIVRILHGRRTLQIDT
ncbi:MAG: type II toxin-antitoxin system RelE/ParE family toxin [Pseudomonadota bacterium]